MGGRVKVAPRRRISRIASDAAGAAGYILTRAAARFLSEANPELFRPPDDMMFAAGRSPYAARLRSYQISPALCIQSHHLVESSVRFRSLLNDAPSPKILDDKRFFSSRRFPWKKRPVLFAP
jgi:glycosyl transferase family 25